MQQTGTITKGQKETARQFVAQVIKREEPAARFITPFTLPAKNFVTIARPGDVFEYQSVEYTVETVCADPLVIHAILGGIAKAVLMPKPTDDISWKEVAQ